MIERVDLRMFDPENESHLAGIGKVAEHLRGGGAIAYPTETVYGFGSSLAPEAVRALRGLKGRPDAKPLLALISDRSMAPSLRWTPEAEELASLFWPGALTLILTDSEGAFPPGVRSEEGGVAVRVSPHPTVSALVQAFGAPITSTSANAPGTHPAIDADQAEAAFLALQVDPERVLVVDGGTLPRSASSTLIDCTGDAPRVLREGAVPLSRLRCALPDLTSADS